MLYPYLEFNIYFFKIFFIHVFVSNCICLLRFLFMFFGQSYYYSLFIIIINLLFYQYISTKWVLIYTYKYKTGQIKQTRSKDPVENIAVLSAGTIFVIRQRLALNRDYWLTHLRKFRKVLFRFPMKDELVLLII